MHRQLTNFASDASFARVVAFTGNSASTVPDFLLSSFSTHEG